MKIAKLLEIMSLARIDIILLLLALVLDLAKAVRGCVEKMGSHSLVTTTYYDTMTPSCQQPPWPGCS
jgi:hypothetical protein